MAFYIMKEEKGRPLDYFGKVVSGSVWLNLVHSFLESGWWSAKPPHYNPASKYQPLPSKTVDWRQKYTSSSTLWRYIPPMVYAYPPTRIPYVNGNQVYELDRLHSISIGMWLVPGEQWYFGRGSTHLP